ncbi:zinc finger, CCHC-type containing protein [Tanacetum coccineum]|uniref:Zinc finger, CCHC-type containing protein n=1 Tax=Tanacetum coccineum TaxID=301880 RepID=A0ABQ5HJM2_9ASTR
MDESISVSSIIDKLPPSWKDFKHTLKHGKDDLSLVQLGSHLRIEESLRAQDSDKGKGKQVDGPSVNMTEEGKNKNKKQNKGKKCDFKEHVVIRRTKMLVVWERGLRTIPKTKVDAIAWWIDFGAITHVCKDRCWFKTYEPVEDGSVLYMGDDHFAHVHGKGSVVLEFSSGKSITLFNVLYVPKLCKNLIYGLVLNKCGYKQVYKSDKYILLKCGVFVGFGYYNNGMFMLNLNKNPDDSNSVYMSSSAVVNSSLWHARLGHVHYKRMLEMYKDELIHAIDENPNKCTTCMLTKITRQPFKSITRKSVILELIHYDLCNFHATPSLGNKKYVITFIDDTFRFCYVYLLHAKDEALDKFRIYKTEVELQQNDLIKTLRTDRGGEYYDPVFFQSVGIIHETTAPYTPQQNGVAERKNRALKEMVNSMLSYSGLSEGFWGEAMLTACYLLNRVPNKRNKTTPYELWYKKRPNLSFLRVWGCRAVVRLPDPKRKTLGEKGIDCIFVGYAEHSKAYRFYVIEPNDSVSINSIIESRDAIFDENRFSSIPRPKDIIPNSDESQRDDHSDDVPSEIPEPHKGQNSINPIHLQYSIEEDPRTYNEAMQSRDSAFWKEAIKMRLVLLWKIIHGFYLMIFKRKMKVDGTIDKFKARLVIQGFRQKERIDYFDTYAPIARITTIILLLALAAIHNLVIHQMYVKTTFLNGDLEEEVYMKQPEGFVMPGNKHKVCKLVKSLYGLKLAPKQFSMKDMGEADVILGIKIKRENKGTVTTQSHYIEKILKKFNHEDCSPASTLMDPVEKLKPNTGKPMNQLEYSRSIGCLMYVMTSTRPDIAYAVGRLSKFTSNPRDNILEVITRVCSKYLKDSSSMSGWVFLLRGGAISWASKKQTCITGSTIEYEFVALAVAGKKTEVAFCLLEDLTAFCFKTSLRFASRPHCVLLQDLTAFCFKTSLRFASSYHCVLLQHHCVLLKTSIAFCLKTILRFDKKLLWQNFIHHCILLQHHCVLLKTSIAFCLKTILRFDKQLLWQNFILHCVLSRLLHCVLPNNSDDIQAAGSDTRPPMLDRTDYKSCSQRIRLDALGTTLEGGVLLGPERPRTYEDLSDTEKKRYDADVRATNIVLQGLPKDIYKLINHNIEAKAIWDNVKMLLAGSELTKEDRESQFGTGDKSETSIFARGNGTAGNRGTQNRAGNTNAGQGKPVKCYNCNGVRHIARNCTQPKRLQNSNYFKDNKLMQIERMVQFWIKRNYTLLAGETGNSMDGRVWIQPVQDLALNEDNIFQADECDAFDSDVDDEPAAQSIFMANLSSVGIHNKDKSNVIDSTSVHMGNSNVIPYERYLLVNDISGVPSCASSALNSVCVSHVNDAFVPHDPITTELKIYKEHVAIYEQRAKFELTEHEQ